MDFTNAHHGEALSQRCVLLSHTLPDGSHHYDWMLERDGSDGGDGGRLVTFRVHVLVHECGAFDAERVGDHRREYLEYEGEVSRGRGRVVRVASGVCRIGMDSERMFIVDCVFEGASTGEVVMRYTGELMGDVWRFAVHRVSK
jgi:hypothetical protein